MKLSRIIMITSLMVICANANELLLSSKYPIINAYEGQYKGKRSFSDNQKFTQSKCFKKANAYLYNKKYQKNIKITIGDPNVLKSQKVVTSKSPDYVSALRELASCAKDTNNPVAAWEGIKIITSYLGINYKTNIATYKKLSKILYNDKSCDGYLNYGDIFAKGIAEKPNKKKAMKIFKEGKKLCTNSWRKIVFEMKLDNLKHQR